MGMRLHQNPENGLGATPRCTRKSNSGAEGEQREPVEAKNGRNRSLFSGNPEF
jgi:hypothetical protein